jgi:hypothetical protein
MDQVKATAVCQEDTEGEGVMLQAKITLINSH